MKRSDRKRYFLLAHSDDGDVFISSFATKSEREFATRVEIFGPSALNVEEEWSRYLAELRELGAIEFEGDAPIEWREGWLA